MGFSLGLLIASMMTMMTLTSVVQASTVATTAMTPEAQSDLIVDLPGLSSRIAGKRRMFSGMIPVDGTNRELFYWFVESDHGLANRPVMLWTNGGPGCSGLLGFLTEQGPFRPSKNGKLVPNDYAWTRYASIVFIEQPVGVGFSHGAKFETYSDANAATDNYRFIVNFFERFRELKNNEFYISSESYGGHYMPTLAKQIVDRGGVPNFKGFMVGNPLTSGPLRDYGEFATFAGRQLLPKILADQYFHQNRCRTSPDSIMCNHLASEARTIVQGFVLLVVVFGQSLLEERCINPFASLFLASCKISKNINASLDPYGLDFPVCTSHTSHVRTEKLALLKALGLVEVVEDTAGDNGAAKHQSAEDGDKGSQVQASVTSSIFRRALQYFPNRYQPCEEVCLETPATGI